MNIIVASGPVIIEDGKVLLNREHKEYGISDWFFPGGKVEDFDITLEEVCKREAMEELGIEVEILKPLRTIKYKIDEETVAILVHWLAKRTNDTITPGRETAEWDWHDITNLPENAAPNVKSIIADLN